MSGAARSEPVCETSASAPIISRRGRVTDHRIGLTLYKIDSIMDGNLDELIDALVTADQAEKLQNSRDAD